MARVFSIVVLITLLVVGACDAAVINVPALSGNPPVIDGKLSSGEWDNASEAPVCISEKGVLTKPNAHFYIGYSGQNLYFAFVADSMTRMPVAGVKQRDGKVWEDDAMELFIQANGPKYHFIINSAGIIFDSKDDDKDWNAPLTVSTSLIGSDFAVGYAGGEEVKRGFIVEAVIPIDKIGLPIPTDGEEWNMQVAFDMVGVNPQSVWTNMTGIGFSASSMGKLVFGGPANRIEGIVLEDGGRTVRLKNAYFGEHTGCMIPSTSGSPTNLLWARDVNDPIKLQGGAKYFLDIKNTRHYSFPFSVNADMSVPIVAVPVPSKGSFYVAYDPTKLISKERLPIELSFVQKDKTLWETRIDTAKLVAKKTIYVPYKGWGAGSVQLFVREIHHGNKAVEIGAIPLKVPSYVPEWANYKLPKLPAVPEPFESVRAKSRSAQVWGRTYSFGKSPFLDQVSSLGANILASPVILRGKVDGKELKWEMKSWKLISQAPDKVVYAGTAASAGMKLTVKTSLEFDGMLRLDWRLTPVGGKRTVSDLAFVVPVKRDIARSFMQYPAQDYSFNDQSTWNFSGDLTDAGWACKFTSFFWLGDQTRGIQWFAEHCAGWTPADEKKIIQVNCSKKTADLTLHIADGKRVFDKPIDFTFGLIVSPMKPRPAACDLCDSRMAMFSATGQMTNISSQKSVVAIPRSSQTTGSAGCTEVDFRVDWDPDKPTDHEKSIALLDYASALSLSWVADHKALQVIHKSPQLGTAVIGEAPVSLVKGSWHRLAWNYGKQAEVYLDGKLVLSAVDNNPMPAFDWWSMDRIGGSGRIAVRRWRISRNPRTADEVQPEVKWTADANTIHLELLDDDPTPMGSTNPVIGLPYSPGYLSGNWSYDAKEHILIAGEDMPEMTDAKALKNLGIRSVMISEYSSSMAGPDDPHAFTECTSLCNKLGIRVVPYVGWGIADTQPEFEDYRWELSLRGPDEDVPPSWRGAGRSYYMGPVVGSCRKMNLYYVDQCMRMGSAGMYLDGVVQPDDCINPLCGYEPVIDPVTNKPVPVTHIFDRREYMKLLYGLVKYYRKDGIIDAHASVGYPLPTMSFVTDSTNGEALGVMPNWQKFVDPQVIRTEFNGRQYGFNSESLFYNNSPVPLEYGVTLMGIHGETPRCMWGGYPERLAGIWNLTDRFDANTADWMPYYYPSKSAFKSKSSKTLVSAFVHPGKKTLLLVANWSDEVRTDTVHIDWAKLGLTSNAPVKICNWNRPLQVHNDEITLTFKPRQLLFVWIGEESVARS